jgi:hypothetical protein
MQRFRQMLCRPEGLRAQLEPILSRMTRPLHCKTLDFIVRKRLDFFDAQKTRAPIDLFYVCHILSSYSHIDPRRLSEYADRTLLGESPTKSPSVGTDTGTGNSEVIDFGGKGGTRTLDPGIMSAVL